MRSRMRSIAAFHGVHRGDPRPSGRPVISLSAASVQRVQVLYGRVWLTESGRLEDVFAASGEVIDLSRRGLVLVEGLGFARIAVVGRQRAGVPMATRFLDVAMAAIRASARRLRVARWRSRTA